MEPHLVLDAEQLGYRIFAQSGRLDRIGGVIVVHRAAQIRNLGDLRRRTICLPPANALASTMMVRMWLHEAAFDLDRSARVIETTSESNALLTVCEGGADAAGVSREGWKAFAAENPEAAADLEAKWATDTLSGPALLAGANVIPSDLLTLQSAFASLSSTETGTNSARVRRILRLPARRECILRRRMGIRDRIPALISKHGREGRPMIRDWIRKFHPRRTLRRQLIATITGVHMLLMISFVYDLVDRQQSFLLRARQGAGGQPGGGTRSERGAAACQP